MEQQNTSDKTIAVLPFVNMSASADNEYFSDGITEEIINALAKIQSLKVTSRTSSFYFKNINPKEKKYLDLLLLNQGWSTYSLEEKIKEINPKENYAFESGFTLKGNVKKAPKGYDIGILSKKNRLAAFSNLNEKREFTLKNVFTYKNDSVKIAFIKKNEPLKKPNGVAFIKTETENSNFKPFINNSKRIIEEGKQTVNEEKKSLNYRYYPNIELLDEVMLKDVKTKKKVTIYDVESNLALKHNVISSGFYKNKKVTKQMEIMHQTVFDYFMSLGYIKRINLDIYQIVLRHTPATLTGTGSGVFPPRIYVNNQPLIRDITLIIERLQAISMADIDEILINKSGGGGGMDGTGGIIKIYLRKGDHKYFGEENEILYENLVLLTGFDRASNYYKPQYNIYSKEAFMWSEIDWKNLVQTNEKGETIIKVPTNEFSNKFQFIINGFSEDGLLFHDIYKSGNDGF